MTLFSGVIAFNTSSSGLKAAHSYCIKTTTSFTGKFVILELLVFVFLDRAKSLHALGPGGGGGGWGRTTQQCVIRGGSARRSNPLTFYIPFLTEEVPFRTRSIDK